MGALHTLEAPERPLPRGGGREPIDSPFSTLPPPSRSVPSSVPPWRGFSRPSRANSTSSGGRHVPSGARRYPDQEYGGRDRTIHFSRCCRRRVARFPHPSPWEGVLLAPKGNGSRGDAIYLGGPRDPLPRRRGRGSTDSPLSMLPLPSRSVPSPLSLGRGLCTISEGSAFYGSVIHLRGRP